MKKILLSLILVIVTLNVFGQRMANGFGVFAGVVGNSDFKSGIQVGVSGNINRTLISASFETTGYQTVSMGYIIGNYNKIVLYGSYVYHKATPEQLKLGYKPDGNFAPGGGIMVVVPVGYSEKSSVSFNAAFTTNNGILGSTVGLTFRRRLSTGYCD